MARIASLKPCCFISCSKTHPIGKKKPNAWGLYDFHGNVLEWCYDWYGEYPKGAVTDPVGSSEGINRVLRSGCWFYEAESCRSAFRQGLIPPRFRGFHGFRVALSTSGIPE
jgi:formylglycine-generating enzyme required for sulfatase activity